MSNLKGTAQQVAERMVAAFENGTAPKALASVFITTGDRYADRWSFTNRFIVALSGYTDARTYNGWQEVGRQVQKGQKAFYILEPLRVTKGKGTEEESVITIGFKGGARFGLEQTDGEEYSVVDQAHIDSLPLLNLAESWGLSVTTYKGQDGQATGYYSSAGVIALGVENLSTWAHELVHAADDRLGTLTEAGQNVFSETVAELGGAILLHMLGYDEQADDGGCWDYIKHYAKHASLDPFDAISRTLDRTCKAVEYILEESGIQKVEVSI